MKASHFSVARFVFGAFLLAVSTSVYRPNATIAPQHFSATPPKIHFEDIAARAGLTVKTEDGGEKTKKYIIETTGSGAAFLDYDNDGWPDIFLVNGTTLEGFPKDTEPTSHLYHNNRDGTFSEIGIRAGVAYNQDGEEQAGMGADAADYDGDGWLDIIKTNFSDQTASLYRNNQDGKFTDITYEAGLGGNTQFLGWGTLFVDVDNDGWPDLFMANGHVYPELDRNAMGSTFRERKLVYWNRHDGKFKDISLDAGPGITKPFNSHGVAAADFDNDGMVELLVNNSHDPPSLLKNNGKHGNWILVTLVGTKSNRDGIGARVTVRAGGHQQLQEVRSGGGYVSQSDLRLHFGLGAAMKIDVLEIRWPSGLVQNLENIPANQILSIKEGVGIVKY